MRSEAVPEHDAAAPQASPTDEVGAFLNRRREQIAQRWADEPLFRAVFTVSRDEAVEAGRSVVDALAQVAASGRVEDSDSAGFTVVREQLARMTAARSRSGMSTAQVSGEVDALRAPVVNLLVADLPDVPHGAAAGVDGGADGPDGHPAAGRHGDRADGGPVPHRPAADAAAGGRHADHQALGRHRRRTAHRHPGQRTQPGRDGDPAGSGRRPAGPLRDPRHHRRADGRLAGRAAPHEDRRGGTADGRGVRRLGHPAA